MHTLTIEALPLVAASHSLLRSTIVTLLDYRDETAHHLVQALKYDGSGKAAELCAQVLAEYLHDTLSEAHLFSQQRIVLIPVPLHTSRARERGFNQISLVLERLPQEFRQGPHSFVLPHILQRHRVTKPQTRLSRSERLSNVAGAFSVPDPQLLAHTHVFLIDDVTTTGATLVNAGNALRRAGAQVTLLALARA